MCLASYLRSCTWVACKGAWPTPLGGAFVVKPQCFCTVMCKVPPLQLCRDSAQKQGACSTVAASCPPQQVVAAALDLHSDAYLNDGVQVPLFLNEGTRWCHRGIQSPTWLVLWVSASGATLQALMPMLLHGACVHGSKSPWPVCSCLGGSSGPLLLHARALAWRVL